MCLRVHPGAERLMANKDIPVYKVLTRTGPEPGFWSIFYKCRWKKGETKQAVLDYPDEDLPVMPTLAVNRGLHAFLGSMQAHDYACTGSEFVAKMVIPRGSFYYEGAYHTQVASQTLRWTQ